MYKVDDMVMYGSFGICKVTAIEKRDLTGEEQEYYILKHINSEKNIFYVPTNNDKALSKMHRICSKAEVDELISHMNSEGLIWIDNDIKRKELAESGKKLRSTDENYLSLAENMLFEELAYALDIDRSEVVEYIEKHIA